MIKYIGIIILVVLILVGCFIFYLYMQRETKNWQEKIEVAQNTIISIDFMASNKVYYGGHGLGFGGGDDKDSFKYKYKGIDYFHETPYTPIVMKLHQDNFYIVYFDRTNMDKISFQFFKSLKDGTFEKIKPELFPKSIAIQNRWLKDKDTEALKEMNANSEFSSSLTAKIWQQLEANKQYYESSYSVPEALLKNYKKKYIK